MTSRSHSRQQSEDVDVMDVEENDEIRCTCGDNGKEFKKKKN